MNDNLFVSKKSVFVVVSSNGNETGQKQKQKSFFHILTIDLKRFFIRNGNETEQINNLVNSQTAKIRTLHCEAETVVG